MKTQWFQNKKILISIIIAQILVIIGWLYYLSRYTGHIYRVVVFTFGNDYPIIFGISINPNMGSIEHLIFQAHIFISLPILLLYRIWIFKQRLNNQRNIKNLQFALISLSTILLIQTLTQLLLVRKIYPEIYKIINDTPVYIWSVEYNGSFANLAAVAFTQARIFLYSGAILYLAAFVSMIKTVFIPYFQKKIYSCCQRILNIVSVCFPLI